LARPGNCLTNKNADTFVDWLVRQGLLVCDPVVDASLQGPLKGCDPRTVQRHFLRATGLPHSAAWQIERARYATCLLQEGVSILDTVEQAGYFDQPHLTRSLKRYIGQTPAQILQKSRPEQMSFLYKTLPIEHDTITIWYELTEEGEEHEKNYHSDIRHA
jgi:hypothetical protein